MEKICCQCGELKPVEEFWKRAASRDGLYPSCKHCAAKKGQPPAVAARIKSERARLAREERLERINGPYVCAVCGMRGLGPQCADGDCWEILTKRAKWRSAQRGADAT